jgi:hypothetical protein
MGEEERLTEVREGRKRCDLSDDSYKKEMETEMEKVRQKEGMTYRDASHVCSRRTQNAHVFLIGSGTDRVGIHRPSAVPLHDRFRPRQSTMVFKAARRKRSSRGATYVEYPAERDPVRPTRTREERRDERDLLSPSSNAPQPIDQSCPL